MQEPRETMVDALADYLADDEDPISATAPSFEVANQHQANRLLRRLARVEEQVTEAHQLATAEVERVNAWLGEVTGPLMETRAWLVRALEGYARRVHEEDPRKQTMKLPNGQLQLRKAAVSVEVRDEGQVLTWGLTREACEMPPVLTEQKPAPPRTLDKTKAKQVLRPYGVHVDERTGEWLGEPVSVKDGVAYYLAVDEEGEIVPGVLLTRDPSGFTFTVKADAGTLRVVQ